MYKYYKMCGYYNRWLALTLFEGHQMIGRLLKLLGAQEMGDE